MKNLKRIRCTTESIERSIIFISLALCMTMCGLIGSVKTNEAKASTIKIISTESTTETTLGDTDLYIEEPTEKETTVQATKEKTTTIISTTKKETTTKKITQSKKSESRVAITDDEYNYICRVVMGEAGGDGWESEVAVAQCYYNGMKKENVDAYTLKGMYGYYGTTSKEPTEEVKRAVYMVFYEGYQITSEPILYFYAPKYCNGNWHETQTYVATYGTVRFFKQKGT